MVGLQRGSVAEMAASLPPEFAVADANAWMRGRYRAPLKLLARLERLGAIVRLKRGLYAFAEGFDPLAAAAALHGPSYVSFETALAFYGMIPERVSTILSVVDGRPATFVTPGGVFEYRAQRRDLYAMGMTLAFVKDRSVPIANREKALLDAIARARLKTAQATDAALLAFVAQGLRIDDGSLAVLSRRKLRLMSRLYRSAAPARWVAARWRSPR
jgi:predicted transcriptional regulator of viral defense system